MAEGYTVVPLSPLRKVIAARMTEAKQTIPHFRLGADLQVDALLALRLEMRGSEEPRPSFNDLLVKACAAALMDAPEINSQWVNGEIRQFAAADIAVVVALERGGLATPIVRAAQSKSVRQIARELRELSARAAKNALNMDEVFGGSFSISNLGMHSIDEFDAIINPPQCAILAIGSATPRLVVNAAGATRTATVMRVTLSVDHRALDGVGAARFLTALRHHVAAPDGLLAEG